MDPLISKELIQLAEKDLQVREKLLEEDQLSGAYHPEMEQIHKQNAKRLREIIRDIGFPTVSKVGAEASDAAWLIIQHSIGEPAFMKECYTMMLENQNDISRSNIAYLYDRIQVFQSKPQRYGTQLTTGGVPYPVENKTLLNEKRSQAELPLLSQTVISNIADIEKIPEIDRQDKDYNVWRIKTGWLSDL